MKNAATPAFAAILCLFLAGCIDNGAGQKIGQVTKLAKQGVLCKTWEGEIIRGGFSPDGNGVQGGSFHFTVESDALAKKIQDAMERRLEIRLKYRSELISFCRSESNSQFVTDIEDIGPGSAVHSGQNPAPANRSERAPAPSGGSFDSERLSRIERLLEVQGSILREIADANRK